MFADEVKLRAEKESATVYRIKTGTGNRALRFYRYFFALNFFLFCGESAAKKSNALLDFYRTEQQNWIETALFSEKALQQPNWDVLFYHIDVDIGYPTPYIRGAVLCRFRAVEDQLTSISMNLHRAFTIDSLSGNIDKYIFRDDTLHIELSEPLSHGAVAEIGVHYQGVPEPAGQIKGLVYRTHGKNEPVIVTLSTPYLAHYWWPCKDGPGDKPDSVYIDITIPDITIEGLPLIAVSNGLLENIAVGKGKRTFQWRERFPIAPYYVMAAVSNYRHFDQKFEMQDKNSFPIDYYVFDENFNIAQEGVRDLPRAMEIFSSLFGRYPFPTEKYGQTELGFYGAIENQTNSVINSMSESWFSVAVHELTHMWFGDMITCADWHHGWLNEGFATYCESLYLEFAEGKEAYHRSMADNEYFEDGTLYLEDTSDPFQIFIDIIYLKGAYVLHMLRGVLGDSVFFDCLANYAADPRLRYGHATTADFQSVCEQTSGKELDYFFDQWVYDSYYPEYRYDFYQDSLTLHTWVSIYQVQSESGRRPVFEMPVQLRFEFEDGTDTLVSAWNDQRTQTFSFSPEKKIEACVLDPDKWILRKTEQVTEPPSDFFLDQNYPNPFNTSTTFSYRIPFAARVNLAVYNTRGEQVEVLVDRFQSAGFYFVSWDGRDQFDRIVSSGVYFCHLKAGDLTLSRKMLFLR